MNKIVLYVMILVLVTSGAETIKESFVIEGNKSWSAQLLLHPQCDMKSLSVTFVASESRSQGSVATQLPMVGAVNDEMHELQRTHIKEKNWRVGQLGVYKLVDLYCRLPEQYDSVLITYTLEQQRRKRVKFRSYHYAQLKESVSNPAMFEQYERAISRKREKETLAILIPEKVKKTLSSLDAYIAHKEKVGYEVLLITDDQWGGGIGDDAAENIRLWIEDNYETKGLDYILFIGYPHTDKGEVPMKMTWPQFQLEKYREAPTDFYFAELTGNWDVDGDGNYGEFEDDFMKPGGPDHYPELNIGRIPVFSKTKTDHILNKMIKYESEKFADAMQWRKNVLLPMNNMNAESDPNFTPGIRLAEVIKYDILEPAGYRSFRIFDDNYDGFDLKTSAELTPCTYQTVKETWNSQDFGLVVWQAHGFAQHATDVMSIPFSKVLNDDKVPFVFSTSCHNGSTNTDNLSMYLIQNGAINMVSATRVEYWIPGQKDFWDEWPSGGSMAYGYTKNLVQDSMPSSVALNRVKSEIKTEMLELNSMWWMNWLVYHVYGDPTQGIYSTIDKGTVVKHPPVLSKIDTIKLTKEKQSTTITLSDFVSDEDNTTEELQWEIEASTLFDISVTNAACAVEVMDASVSCADTVTVTVTDPDDQFDTQELVIQYDGGTGLADALPLTEQSGIYLCDNPLSAGKPIRYILTDETIKTLGLTIYDYAGNQLYHKKESVSAGEKEIDIPYKPLGAGSLCLLFTCYYEKEIKQYKAVLGVKK